MRRNRDFEEFQQNLQVLEKELETLLDQPEKLFTHLKTKNNHLVLKNETLKLKGMFFDSYLIIWKLWFVVVIYVGIYWEFCRLKNRDKRRKSLNQP